MNKKTIDFSFQAPYYTLGDTGAETKNIWMIFHGYGQLASDFVKQFEEISLKENILIFPQGLSTFYLKGVADKIGSSWMTSHDREINISNYLNYLDHIYHQEIMPHALYSKLNILGFSQGGHTASRWISHAKLAYNKLVLWGTSLAHEINKEQVEAYFSKGDNVVVIGDNDRFIDQNQLSRVRKRYSKIGFIHRLKEYKGGHDIYPEILQELF